MFDLSSGQPGKPRPPVSSLKSHVAECRTRDGNAVSRLEIARVGLGGGAEGEEDGKMHDNEIVA